MSKHTIITHFDEDSYQKLYSVLNYDPNEKINHIPYGRIPNEIRNVADTLPLHITVSSSEESLSELTNKLKGFVFQPFEVCVDDIGLSGAKQNSHFLYFKIKQSKQMDALLEDLFNRIGNDKYKPGNAHPHLTICISKDIKKIHRIIGRIEKQSLPFKLRIVSLGLYEIWPGVLKSIYYSSQ